MVELLGFIGFIGLLGLLEFVGLLGFVELLSLELHRHRGAELWVGVHVNWRHSLLPFNITLLGI